ncbi:MAG: S8 family serine peptidase [Puniceicoccaceae bacterium]
MTRQRTRNLPAACLVAVAAIMAVTTTTAKAEKMKIESVNDLPRKLISLQAMPSAIVNDGGAPLEALLTDVEKDAREILEQYEIGDETALKGFYDNLYAVAFVRGEWNAVLELGAKVKPLHTKPAQKAVSNIISDSYAAASLAAGGADSEGFAEEFSKQLAQRLELLDYELVQDNLQFLKGQFEMMTPHLVLGHAMGGMDPNAEAQGMEVSRDFAATILGVMRTVQLVEQKQAILEPLMAYLEANTIEKPDRWSERLVDLSEAENLTPVVVGNWDSGMDPSVFPGRLWVNENETANGQDDDGNGFVDDIHGIAFGIDNEPSTGALQPMPEEDLARIDDLLDLIVGAMDQQANIDSEAARKLRGTIAALAPEDVQDYVMMLGRLGLYSHGTMTAYTSVEDNPAARLLYVRFTFDVKPVPDPFDEAYAESFSKYIQRTVDYLKEANARVVNMSWRVTTPMIEGSLASVEPDEQLRRDRAIAIYDTMLAALVSAFESAPEILFVAGAGNEDESVDFVRSMPAGIQLPNVLTVGAVDSALEPASFTSFGKSINLYANGFEVQTKMPGGKPTMISGTSLAAPYVTNLAAKLWAIDPALSVAEVRSLIETTITVHGENEMKVIHPKAAVHSMQGN